MFNKKQSRLRRCKKLRFFAKKYNKLRLVVYKTSKHIYSQIILFKNNNSYVLASSSTLEKNNIGFNKKVSASIIGKNIAIRSINIGIKKVVFDRSGFKYHGRIKILAEYARKYGLLF